jgi:hypothetical protein
VLVAALAIAGCAPEVALPPRPVMVKVPVPVPVYCPIPKLQNPGLPIASLNPDSAPSDTMRAYAASVVILKAAVGERDHLLDGCRHPSATQPSNTVEKDAAAEGERRDAKP